MIRIPERGGSPRPPTHPKGASTKTSNNYNALRSDLSLSYGESREVSQLRRRENEKKENKSHFICFACPQWLDAVERLSGCLAVALPGGRAVAMVSWRPVIGGECLC